MSDIKTKATIQEVSFLIFEQVIKYAVTATKTMEKRVIATKQSKVQKAFGFLRNKKIKYEDTANGELN